MGWKERRNGEREGRKDKRKGALKKVGMMNEGGLITTQEQHGSELSQGRKRKIRRKTAKRGIRRERERGGL